MDHGTMDIMEEENNPFGSINGTTIKERGIPITEYLFVITQFVHFCAAIVGLSAQIFLIVVICRYKKLKTGRNLMILNMLAMGSVYYITTMSFFVIDLFWFWSIYLFINVTLQLQSTTLMLYILFSTLLALDWSTEAFNVQWAKSLRSRGHWIYALVYCASLLELICAVVYVQTHLYTMRLSIANLIYLICAVVMIALNAHLRRRSAHVTAESLKTKYSFEVANIVIFFMLPCLLWNLLYFFVMNAHALDIILLLNAIPSTLWMAHPVYMTYKLGEMDKNFKMAFAKSLRRGEVRDYDDDGLDDDETEDDSRGLVRDVESNVGSHLETVI